MPNVPRRLVIWSDIPSHHQAPWIKLLATEHGFDLTYVVMESIGASERASQGWPETDLSMIDVRVMPSPAEIRELTGERKEETLHVITGGFAWPCSRLALRNCLRNKQDFAILAEPPFPYAKFFAAKNFLQKVFCRISGSRVKGIWAIGRIAYDFYRGIGYSPEQVFEWAYFPPVPVALPPREPRREPKVFYIGQFNERKGVDLLLEALDKIKLEPWTATLVGGGELTESLKARIQALGLGDHVKIEPFKPYSEAMAMLAQADLVVVPSRHDGWGAV
ncbi:MAG: glycosyltransferase, partial [Armatimonadota bacterium]